jgi:hypothetical protein
VPSFQKLNCAEKCDNLASFSFMIKIYTLIHRNLKWIKTEVSKPSRFFPKRTFVAPTGPRMNFVNICL